jgi:hypothetical protein
MLPLFALILVLSFLVQHDVAAEVQEALSTHYKSFVEPWPCNETVNHVDRAKIYFSGEKTSLLYATSSECYQCSKSLLAYGSVGALSTGLNCGLLW